MAKQVIYKYSVSPGPFSLELPKGAKFLSVQTQRNEPQAWFVVDSGAPKEQRRFLCIGTGHEFEEFFGEFLGTFQLHGGSLVFHLFSVSP